MNRRFLLFIGLALIAVFLLELNAPSKFSWKPTYSHRDEQPLGCAVMDTLLAASLPGRYSVSNLTLPQIARQQSATRRAIIVLAEDFSPSETDQRAIRKLLNSGNDILIVANRFFPNSVSDYFKVSIYTSNTFNVRLLQRSIQSSTILFSEMQWAEQKPYARYSQKIYSQFAGNHMNVNDPRKIDTLLTRVELDPEADIIEPPYSNDSNSVTAVVNPSDRRPVLVTMPKGRGRLLICSAPLLFTNYGALDNKIRPIIFRTLSQFGPKPVVRTEAYLPREAVNQETPLRFFLQHPPLRWALYTTLLGLLLFFIFTARRRQRIIPVVSRPENKSLEFVKLIGTLYHQRHDNRDLIEKKYRFVSETIRRRFMIDITDSDRLADTARQLARRTGRPEDTVRLALQHIDTALSQSKRISDSETRRIIDAIDSLLGEGGED